MKHNSLSHIITLCLTSILLLVTNPIWAEQSEDDSNPEHKTKPDNDKENPLDNVDINIIQRDGKTIETHSVNGIVYKVKVQPENAPAYYLYDTNGDGTLDTRSNRELSNTTVQQWKIFEW
jgi:hypothetical protein